MISHRYLFASGLIALLLACKGDPFFAAPRENPYDPEPRYLIRASTESPSIETGTWLSELLAVRVLDQGGRAMPNVEISWRVPSDGSALRSDTAVRPEYQIVSVTDASGIARAQFYGWATGKRRVDASVQGHQVTPVQLWVVVRPLVIWVDEGAVPFYSEASVLDFTAPVGLPVSFCTSGWFTDTVHVVSTAAPPGGEHFDSGILHPAKAVLTESGWEDPWEMSGCFSFTPAVEGTWEFVNVLTGQSGTLTAREGLEHIGILEHRDTPASRGHQ